MKNRRLVLLTALLALALLAGCSKQQPATSNSQQPSQAAKYDPASAATVTGVIHFAGAAPKARPINMSGDPDCAGQNYDESLVVRGGRLANVVVYVKKAPPVSGGLIVARAVSGSGDTPDPTSGIIHQRGCRYEPHVVAVWAGTPVVIFNNDETTHNVHPKPHANHEWNASQLPHAEPLTRTFTQPELMIPVTCNVHPWMKAYVNVMDTPFFAVSDEDGAFTIRGLPPGTYTLAALHETMGEQTAQITVSPKENKTTDFTFSVAANPASAAR